MSSVQLTATLAERLNDQYWNSDRTIDDIVGREGVSRNRLYESIRPYSTAKHCSACGEELVFANRRSRIAGMALCPACGKEANVEQTWTPASNGKMTPKSEIDEIGGSPAPSNGWGLTDRKKAMIGGAAALGLMLGAAATRVIKD